MCQESEHDPPQRIYPPHTHKLSGRFTTYRLLLSHLVHTFTKHLLPSNEAEHTKHDAEIRGRKEAIGNLNHSICCKQWSANADLHHFYAAVK